MCNELISHTNWICRHSYNYYIPCSSFLVCGLSVGLMPLVGNNFVLLCCLAVVFGLTFASSFSFTPTILVQIVDLEDFTCAYGLILLTQGVGNLVGPPIAGIIFDVYET